MSVLHAKLWEALHNKIIFKLPYLTPPRVLKLENSVFYSSQHSALYTNDSIKILNFGFKLFYARLFAKIKKIIIFEHYERTKTKFIILVLVLEEEGMLQEGMLQYKNRALFLQNSTRK